ncbi:MAG: VWA domain-containing protein [Rubrivivax sp.]
MIRPPSPRQPWWLAPLSRRARWALVSGLAMGAAAAAVAHDWPSPGPGVPSQPPPGLVWAGPEQGAPAEPQASDCARPPRSFSVASGLPMPGPQPGWREPSPPPVPMLGSVARTLSAPTAKAAPAMAASPAAPGRAERASADSAAVVSASPSMALSASVSPPQQPGVPSTQATQPAVTAGRVDDNSAFGEFRRFLERHQGLVQRPLTVDNRVRVSIVDAQGRPVPDVALRVQDGAGAELPVWARTDAGGQAWLMPQADARWRGEAAPWVVTARTRVGGQVLSQQMQWRPGQRDALQIRLEGAKPSRPRMDVAFVIDATGSMADEIDKLKRSMRSVAASVASMPGSPVVCYALVAYRDRSDAFYVRASDFTDDLNAFQKDLAALQAGGGGDYPEAQNEALHTAIHQLSWRGSATARVIVLLADAPPHQDYGAPHADHNARAAAARGIKVMGIAASGMDRAGELVMRQVSQFTGGRFVFLTYDNPDDPASGPGRHTNHEVSNYSVQPLDRLVARLLREEMARWPGA